MKRILSVILTIMLVFGTIPFSIFTVSASQSGNYIYTFFGTNATITGYSGAGGDVTIPSTLDEYTVTSIGVSAFYGCSSLTSITLPSTVSSIDDSAFSGCSGLTSITIPSAVTSIGSNTFFDCIKLTSITLPSTITSIGSNAFSECPYLIAAYFFGNAPTMGSSVFNSCAPTFKVYYLSGKTGFTNPWNGYTTTTFGPPITPTGLKSVSASYNSIKLTWNAVSKQGYTVFYTVYRYNGSAYVAIKNLSATSFIDTSLTTGTKYIYKVSAYITVDTSNIASGLTAYVSATPTLGTPSVFNVARYSASSIKLSFGAVSGASGYTIYRYNASSKTYVALASTTSGTYINTGLTKNTTYYYKVAAYHLEGTKKVYGAMTVAKSAKPY